MAEDRSSNVDFEDCPDCAQYNGSGICSNCEGDGGHCVECGGDRRCIYCEGTGRKSFEPDSEELARIRAAGPLTPPKSA